MCRNVVSGCNNLSYIQLTLREIALVKQLFVYAVELGDEAFIPRQLNQKELPQCYTFYNPILSIIQEMCSD